ncbi:MAG TPA: hypothetical protein VLV86_23130 [Vicinamibacterales bacterium]|nr:hypothetical protein [Vicinamibacterales bacterium]
MARRELGPDAIVLSTELVALSGWRGWIGRREVELTVAAEREPSDARPAVSAERQPEVDPASREALARLIAAGVSREFAQEVVDAMPGSSRRGASHRSLQAALADRLSAIAAPDERYAPVEVFVGPPGAGKTTTIAKIAAQERVRGGQLLGLVATDTFRVGAVEQLQSYAEIIGTPFNVARNADDLKSTLRHVAASPVLVDTAGRSPAEGDARDLLRLLAGRKDVRTHLVLPADISVASAARVFDAYNEARPTRVVLTKLDETDSLSRLVGLLREWRLPVSYLGTGQRVPDDLNRATAHLLAESVLGEAVPLHAI